MKLTKALVREFEREQQTYGTEVALFNLLWTKATDDMRALGVTRVQTANPKDAR